MSTVKHMFSFSPERYSEAFARQGYVTVPQGVSPDFLAYATEQLDEHRRVNGNIAGRFDRRGMKEQYLFEFPDDDELIDAAVNVIAALTGLPAEDLLISERHYKVYRKDADQNPIPHKDRKSSQISLGIPLRVPDATRVIVYPDHESWDNPYDSYDELLRSLPEDKLPQNCLVGITPVELQALPGDVIVFHGARMFHERINGAGSQVLYLKWNALSLDPIGENLTRLPRSKRRTTTRAMEPA